MKKLSKLQKRKLKILEDTVKYYGENPVERRCISNDLCHYSGKVSGKNTDGCAVGRLLSMKRASKIDRKTYYSSITTVIKSFPKVIPPHIKKLGVKYLQELQRWHDTEEHFNNSGINKEGMDFIDEIRYKVVNNII